MFWNSTKKENLKILHTSLDREPEEKEKWQTEIQDHSAQIEDI